MLKPEIIPTDPTILSEVIEALLLVYNKRPIEDKNDVWVWIDQKDFEAIASILKRAGCKETEDEH